MGLADLIPDSRWDLASMAPAAPGMLRDHCAATVNGMGLEELIATLKTANMGCTLDTHGRVWLGHLDPKIHDHERWVFIIDPELDRVYRIGPESFLSDLAKGQRLAYVVRGGLNNFSLDLKQAMVEGKLDASSAARSTVLDRFINSMEKDMFASYRAYANLVYSNRVWDEARLDLNVLHDLVYHFDSWQAKNPENADLPRELVMGMYGFARIGSDLVPPTGP